MKKIILAITVMLPGIVNAHSYHEHHHFHGGWNAPVITITDDYYIYHRIAAERRREVRQLQLEREYRERKFDECQYYLDTEQYRRYEFRCE